MVHSLKKRFYPARDILFSPAGSLRICIRNGYFADLSLPAMGYGWISVTIFLKRDVCRGKGAGVEKKTLPPPLLLCSPARFYVFCGLGKNRILPVNRNRLVAAIRTPNQINAVLVKRRLGKA